MIYTDEEKARLESLLSVFQTYTSSHNNFDILYSEKRGYIHLTLEKDFIEATYILNADHLFRLLFIEISNDVQDLHMCGMHFSVDPFPEEILETRKRLAQYLAQLPVDLRDHYTALLEIEFDAPHE